MTILIAIIIFLVGVAGGAWPIIIGKKPDARQWLIDGEAFARGIFLSAAIIHMLPDAEESLHAAIGDVHYPYTFVLAIVTVWLFNLLRQAALRICQHTSSHIHQHIQPYSLMLVLCIHSIIFGGALGISDNIANTIAIAMAVIAHKGADSFALVINMRRCQWPTTRLWIMLVFFACMTPLGMVLGHGLHMYLETTSGQLALAIFSAIAAGTFLYVAMDEVLSNSVSGNASIVSVCYFGLGIAVMALVAMAL